MEFNSLGSLVFYLHFRKKNELSVETNYKKAFILPELTVKGFITNCARAL